MPTRTRSTKARSPSKPTPYAARQRRLKAGLRALGHASLLVTNPKDIRYLTGFHGDASHLLVTQKRSIVISDFRFQEELADVKGVEVYIRPGVMLDAVRTVVGDLAPASVAIQAEAMSVETRGAYAKVIGAKRIKDTSGLLRELRVVKDDSEIALIRRAIAIQEAALTATLKQIKPGHTELEVAAILEFEMKVRGSPEPSFDTIAAARANSSLPHAIPGKVKTAAGQPLLIDWGATCDGYHSDMTRTFSFGKWSKQMGEVYRVVLAAHEASLAAVAPGKTGAEVDLVGRRVIEDAGYGPQFGHATGHGIGLDIHEEPRLAKNTATVLRPGMVVTIEPGIYLPGVGGVRIEDDVIVTERGGKSLCSLPKDIHWATL